eukprot:6121-Heterococcus_DN1.PRE.2
MADTHVFGMSAPATTLSGGSWSANPLTVPETMYSSQPGAGQGHKLQSQYTVVKPEPGVAVAASAPVFPAQPAATDAKTKKLSALRRGKWTQEEESYANRLIQEFKNGLLPLTDGTTLRTFLSKLLNCDPMRISKKFVGSNCIGKQSSTGHRSVSGSVLFSGCCSKADCLCINAVAPSSLHLLSMTTFQQKTLFQTVRTTVVTAQVFRRRQDEMDKLTHEDIERNRAELADLERCFLERVAQINKCKGGSGGPRISTSINTGMPQQLQSSNNRLSPTDSSCSIGAGVASPASAPPWMLPPTAPRPPKPAAPGSTMPFASSSSNSSSSNSSNYPFGAMPIASSTPVITVTSGSGSSTVVTVNNSSSNSSSSSSSQQHGNSSFSDAAASMASPLVTAAAAAAAEEDACSGDTSDRNRATSDITLPEGLSVRPLGEPQLPHSHSMEALALLDIPHSSSMDNLAELDDDDDHKHSDHSAAAAAAAAAHDDAECSDSEMADVIAHATAEDVKPDSRTSAAAANGSSGSANLQQQHA